MGARRNQGSVDLREQLCSRHCSYYKPGKDEEMACGGYLLLQRLIARQPVKLDAVGTTLRKETADRLSPVLCRTCPFFEDGCDFAATVAGAAPCGGFVVIARLLESGAVSIDGLRHLL